MQSIALILFSYYETLRLWIDMFVCDQVLEYSFVLEAVISGPFRLPSNSKMNGIISLPAVNDGFKPDLMF